MLKKLRQAKKMVFDMYLYISSFQCSSFLLEGPDFYQVSFPSAQRTSFSISYSPGLVTTDLSLILNLSLFHFHSFFFFLNGK